MGIKGAMLVVLAVLLTACSQASEQGTVQVETEYGRIVKVHQPGENFSCISWWCDEYPVDLRDHMDGVDCNGVTKDNIAFYMKVDVVYKPDATKVAQYVETFGASNEGNQRDARRFAVLRQHVMNACRNATSGKYDAYGLRAQQNAILAEIYNELKPKMASEMFLLLNSVGMEIQPQFNDPRIDAAANAVVEAQKRKEAEQQFKEAAEIKLQKEQIENQIYTSSPQAYQIRLLELRVEEARAWSAHQGPLVFGSGGVQIQVPAGR